MVVARPAPAGAAAQCRRTSQRRGPAGRCRTSTQVLVQRSGRACRPAHPFQQPRHFHQDTGMQLFRRLAARPLPRQRSADRTCRGTWPTALYPVVYPSGAATVVFFARTVAGGHRSALANSLGQVAANRAPGHSRGAVVPRPSRKPAAATTGRHGPGRLCLQ
ncbi:hypothetical protein D3C80_1511760 [compost metagenome]